MPNSFPARCAGLLLVFSTLTTVSHGADPQQKTGSYELAQTFKVGGQGSWDYLTVDPEHKLLYVPRTTHTMVINADSGKTVADIPGQKRNHGVAIVPETGRGYISDGTDASVVIFDLKTNDVLGKVKTDKDADGIVYDPASRKVFVVCGTESKVFPISSDVDPKSGHADAAIDLGGEPEFLAADGQGKLYINLMNKDQVAVVDTKTMKVVEKWSTKPGGQPVGMAMDRDHRRLFIGCRDPQKLIVMSTDDGKVLADLPIGASVDAVQFDKAADGGSALASCRDGTLSIARETSPGKFEIVQTVTTRPGARTMGLDPTTHTIFLPTAEFGDGDAKSKSAPKPDSFMILVVRPAHS
jgi:DNA-binding beta-propeller fold protein YncE